VPAGASWWRVNVEVLRNERRVLSDIFCSLLIRFRAPERNNGKSPKTQLRRPCIWAVAQSPQNVSTEENMGHKHAALLSVVPRTRASRVAQMARFNRPIPARGLEHSENCSSVSVAPANQNERP
jgi:hypothetical protein